MPFYSILSILGLVFVVNIVNSSSIQNITSTPHIFQPILLFIYKVNLTDFQEYIDPRFTVATFNGSAHIVIYFRNETEYPVGQPSLNALTSNVQSIGIYTIVKYNNTLRREELSIILKNLPATLPCKPYFYIPYDCHVMNQESKLSWSNQSGLYYFYSVANILRTNTTAEVNVTINFLSGTSTNSSDLNTLAGFYLSRQNNENAIQSLYQQGGNGLLNSLPIATAMLYDLFYTEVVQCAIQNLASNYIRAVIGPITGLGDEQTPVMCLYAPYGYYDATPAVPTKTG